MSNFFRLNSEKKIGFKKLSSADLGLSATSHQTHIGLYDNMLCFLPDSHIEKAAILIYDDFCDILSCEYGKINRKNGKIDAPKVQSGNRSQNTIVRKIRTFAKAKPNLDWFLVWFGTDSDELVFWLISSDSPDFIFVQSTLDVYGVYDESSPSIREIVTFLENKINGVSDNILKDLEIVSQVGDYKNKYKAIDLERAAKCCKEVGRRGEELIAEYLEREMIKRDITNYVWENRSRELGKPFDFIIDPNLPTQKFVDVKSTRFDFSQDIVFSENEISFISELCNDKRYSAFRVFDIYEEQKKLIVCNNCLRYLNRINSKIDVFHKDLARRKAYTKSLSIAVKPNICFKQINDVIIL